MLAVGTSIALGQLPRDNPLVPALHIKIPGISDVSAALDEPEVRRLDLPKVVQSGGVLTVGGRVEPARGTVRIDIHWNARPWRTVYSAPLSGDGTYEAPIDLSKAGRLNIRVLLPNGDKLRGSVRVLR